MTQTPTLDDLVLPSTEAEEWRYSRIAELDPRAYVPTADAIAGQGELVLRLADHPDGDALGGSVVDDTGDPFVGLNARWARDALFIDVPAGRIVEEPVELTHIVAAAGASFPRVVVRAGADSQVTVVERSASDDVDALVVPVTELIVGPAARVRHVGLQDAGESVTQIGRVAATVAQSGTLELFHVALGGAYARMRFDVALAGRGATGNISALYLASRDQMADFRTFQDHLAPDTTSNLIFKGAVDDQARAVYTGLIRISEQGRGSNANQTNRIVKLSPDAWAESVPNLEIHQNDVHCSHASAVGPIDADQRFYLESRGVPPEAAERLVVNGFFSEILDAVPVPAVAQVAARRIAEELACSAAIRACALADLDADGGLRRVDIDGRSIALVRLDDKVYALGDTCSHAEVSLSEGEVDVDECALECPKHGSLFSLETGEPLSLPAVRPVPTYDVEIVGDDVMVVVS